VIPEHTRPIDSGPFNPADTTEAVVGRHLQAFLAGDIETLLADFADTALLCTPDGALRGTKQIRSFFEQVIPLFPPGATNLTVKQQVVDGDLFYIVWTAESPAVEVPLASDVFVVRDGKVMYQFFAGQVLPR
jgi:hypothetical protein